MPCCNLADSLCRPNQGEESGARDQASGVRTTPFAKPQGVPPKTQSRYAGSGFVHGVHFFSQGMTESGNRRKLTLQQ